MKFEAGKTYKTQSGQKAYIFEVTEDRIFGKLESVDGKWWSKELRVSCSTTFQDR